MSKLLERRLNHEPIAYITGYKEFYGLDFKVTPSALIPRPETELLVELAIKNINLLHNRDCCIADIGTGCGNIAIALAAHLPHAKIYATERSANALEIAQYNSKQHGVSDRIQFLQGNLTDPLPEAMDLIVANLPYIKTCEIDELMPEISFFEPRIALDGGEDGLQVITAFLSRAGAKLHNHSTILLEIGYNQRDLVYQIAENYFPHSSYKVFNDLNGLDRVIAITTEMP